MEKPGLTISIPADSANQKNLENLLKSKGSLIKKALGIADLPIKVEENKILFPWFDETADFDKAKAYTDFISAICKYSKEREHIMAKERPVDNEKYAFRCFLLRLGFIGPEFKKDRKILMQNLDGSASYRDRHDQKQM